MKISTVFLCMGFIAISFNASSQFVKGEKLIGGNATISFGTGKGETLGYPANKSHSLNVGVSPRFSWVTSTNRMTGFLIGVQYQYLKSFVDGSNDYNMSNTVGFNTGYFLRNYKSFSQQAGFFIEYNVNGSYSEGTNTNVYLGVESKSKGKNYNASIQAYPGFYYRMSPRTLIEASFGGLYASYSKNKGETSKSSNFNMGVSFPTNLSLGVQFFLKNNRSK